MSMSNIFKTDPDFINVHILGLLVSDATVASIAIQH